MQVHMYYINRVSLSQDYITLKCSYAVFQCRANRYVLGLSNEPLFIIIQISDLSKLEVQKIALLTSCLLSKMGFEMYQGGIFFGLPTLKGHSFAVP